MKSISNRPSAFTLAEVLITLGIIGIVAALTIPNLMGAYRKKVVETRLARFSSVINQAIRRSEVDNESVEYWGKELTAELIKDEDGKNTGYYSGNTLEWYNKYLAPYLTVLRVEESKNTFEPRVNVYFLDGSMLNFSSSSWIFYPEAKYYEEVEEGHTNSLGDRDRNVSGFRYFTFMLYINNPDTVKSGVIPYGQDQNLSDETLKNSSSLGCRKEMVSTERAYCTLWIARNGWRIPEDYPFKF